MSVYSLHIQGVYVKWYRLNSPRGVEHFSLEFGLCEPSDPPLEHLLESILKTYERLKELGFTYYEGKIVVIETDYANS
jgi:hypothetical protein